MLLPDFHGVLVDEKEICRAGNGGFELADAGFAAIAVLIFDQEFAVRAERRDCPRAVNGAGEQVPAGA